MKTHTRILALSSRGAIVASATDWVTAPSFFTHDPMSGQRVRQSSPIGPFYIHRRGDYRRSGFRRSRRGAPLPTGPGRSHGLRLAFGDGRFGERLGHRLGTLFDAVDLRLVVQDAETGDLVWLHRWARARDGGVGNRPLP